MARFSENGFPLLEYYMGKNTMERQKFIIENLRIEDDSEMDKM